MRPPVCRKKTLPGARPRPEDHPGDAPAGPHAENATGTDADAGVRPYAPTKSLLPNYLVPDLYVGNGDFQFGLSTYARDVTGRYTWDAGVRYDMSESDYSWRLGGKADGFSLRAARYPFSYETERGLEVDETRHDLKLAWQPLKGGLLEVSANWRHYVDEMGDADEEDTESWGSLAVRPAIGNLKATLNVDLFNNGSQSAYGEASYWFGEQTTIVLSLQAGKTWGDLEPGHNTFRIGGNTGEGFFHPTPQPLVSPAGLRFQCAGRRPGGHRQCRGVLAPGPAADRLPDPAPVPAQHQHGHFRGCGICRRFAGQG